MRKRSLNEKSLLCPYTELTGREVSRKDGRERDGRTEQKQKKKGAALEAFKTVTAWMATEQGRESREVIKSLEISIGTLRS